MVPVHGDLNTLQRMPWKVPGFLWTSSLESSSHYPEDLMGSHRFSHRLSLHSVFTLAGRSHGKSKDFPYDSVSWRPLHSPGDASRIPRISHGVSFYRGLYRLQSPLEVQIGWMSRDIHTIYHFQISYHKLFYSITQKGTDDCVPSVFSHCENS